MKIKEMQARVILDSRGEKTIEVSAKTNEGLFSSSAPSGRSKGRNETPAYAKTPEEDAVSIINLSNKISKIEIDKFSDLEKVEEVAKGIVGANPLYALEVSLLKALALEQGKELWQVLNPRAKKFPYPVGNCIEGGMHSLGIQAKKPDLQEFLIIPRARKFVDSVFLMNKAREICGETLKAKNARGGLSDENAWNTNLANDEAVDVLGKARDELRNTGEEVEIGVDFASSSFYNQGYYLYKNNFKRIKNQEQKSYVLDLIKDEEIFYVEDPIFEEDFANFADLRKRVLEESPCLIVGDDLICSQVERLKKAIEYDSINAIIVKPNQSGSLIETAKLVALAKKNGIITIFSHRSGETMDYALADLAFAFQTEFVKTGIQGKEREIKLKRMIEIEKSFG